jgi:hypothetical protein
MTKQFTILLFILLIFWIDCSRLRTKLGVTKIALKKVAPAHIHAISFVDEIQSSINDFSECKLKLK